MGAPWGGPQHQDYSQPPGPQPQWGGPYQQPPIDQHSPNWRLVAFVILGVLLITAAVVLVLFLVTT
ncbi:hypothetical protein [Nocardia sp. XZ_19_385]|uniref:hypothetical protein n=1 Tax=Nocardia sp. XZ_19_385 TaxID=2769488 RepID=UPI00188ECFB9|nr:hypothetical protein [Nocardia sp. XZ_19_385]